MTRRIGFLISHPIQYYAPIFRQLAGRCDLTVFYAHRQTAEQQARAGFGVAFDWDVDLLSGYESRFLTNVARQPSTDRYDGCDTPGIADEIAAGKFDGFVVPGWALRSYWQATRACRHLGVPVMVRGDSQLAARRSFAIRLAKSVVFSHILRRFDGFLYVGQRNREYLQHYGVPSDRLFFSPHCVDNDAFASASAAVRASVGVSPQGPRPRRLLFVGKLIGRKRPADVLEAVAKLGAPHVEVTFVGSGELEPELRRLAAEKGVPCQFMGFLNQSELPAAYVSADFLVLPSDGLETWGLVVNEAMACGIPAVVSDAVGCAPDLVDAGATGQTFGCGDIGGLCEAIRRVLAQDPVQTRRHLAAKMARYSPLLAAEAIVAATATIASRRQLL
jgi:glycosyltransferase involved in cell wall biosynthesis